MISCNHIEMMLYKECILVLKRNFSHYNKIIFSPFPDPGIIHGILFLYYHLHHALMKQESC